MGLSGGGCRGKGGESGIQNHVFTMLFAVEMCVHRWKGWISDENIEVNIWRGDISMPALLMCPLNLSPMQKITRICEVIGWVSIHLRYSNILLPVIKTYHKINIRHILSRKVWNRKAFVSLIRKPGPDVRTLSVSLLWGSEAFQEDGDAGQKNSDGDNIPSYAAQWIALITQTERPQGHISVYWIKY